MKIIEEKTASVIVEFEDGEEIPKFIHKENIIGGKKVKRKLYYVICANCGRGFYSAQTKFCSSSCGARTKVKRDKYSKFRMFSKGLRNRGKKVDISLEYLAKVWEEQDGVCPYTKVKMVGAITSHRWEDGERWRRASLDRIDSSKGYVEGNVQFVCRPANLAKNTLTEEEFLEWIHYIKIS